MENYCNAKLRCLSGLPSRKNSGNCRFNSIKDRPTCHKSLFQAVTSPTMLVSIPGRFARESFRPWVVSPLFGGSFRPCFLLKHQGLSQAMFGFTVAWTFPR